VANSHRDEIDTAPSSEQTSEVGQVQEGDVQTADDLSSTAAEHVALHVVSDDEEGSIDLDEVLDAVEEAADPEADAIVDEALEVDSIDEADAAVAATDDEADIEAEVEAEEDSHEVAPYDGPDVNGDEDEVEAEVDPYEAFKKELRAKPGKWYVIHSYAGFERRVKSNIENRMVSMNMEDYIYQIEVPMEDVVEIKNGQRKLVNRVRIPGYVLVRMSLNEDSWSVVRHTPGVTGFVGNAHNPTPLRFDEAFSMLKSLVEVEAAPAAKSGGAKAGKAAQRVLPAEIDFEIGETITIKEGSFAGLPGSISEIKPESGKLTVLVSLFERETPVELSFDQVTKL
jgi:transcription termination/antitermination protein NusG